MTHERTVFAYIWRSPNPYDDGRILRQLHAHDWGIGYIEQRTITHRWRGLNFVIRVPDEVTDEDAIQNTIEAYQLDSTGLPVDYGPWIATKFGIDEEAPVEVLGRCHTRKEAKALCVPPDNDVDYQSYWYYSPISGHLILTNPEWDVSFEVRLRIAHTSASEGEAQS